MGTHQCRQHLSSVPRRLKGRELFRELLVRKCEIDVGRPAFRRVEQMIERLNANPDDPQANLDAVRFYCLVKGQWGKGLPMLLRADDAALRLRAVYWYLKVQPLLKQRLVKVKADLRIREAVAEHSKDTVKLLRGQLRQERNGQRQPRS